MLLINFGINQDYLILALLVLLFFVIVFCIIMIMKLNRLEAKYRNLMQGEDGKSLEGRMLSRFRALEHLGEEIDGCKERIDELEAARDTAFKKMALQRYDAFQEMGGKLSYSFCLLNDDNDGVILTTMHNREGCYTYMKEIIKGNTFTLLSDEEKSVLEEAMHSDDALHLS